MNGNEFKSNIESTLRQMIEKSGRKDFKVIHTGYPKFFNEKTTYCDYTTFYFRQPGHHESHRKGNWAYLYQDLRAKLTKLVTDLNARLQSIGDDVNKDFSQPRVLFADPNPAFEGHRFCEKGIKEPDPSNQDNWLFLASWPDHSPPGTESKVLSNLRERETLSGVSIPDETTCASTNDWADLMLCGMAKAGIVSNSDTGLVLAPTIELPDSTNISTSEIRWFYPTNWAKTFHPRSSGYRGIRDLVRATW